MGVVKRRKGIVYVDKNSTTRYYASKISSKMKLSLTRYRSMLTVQILLLLVDLLINTFCESRCLFSLLVNNCLPIILFNLHISGWTCGCISQRVSHSNYCDLAIYWPFHSLSCVEFKRKMVRSNVLLVDRRITIFVCNSTIHICILLLLLQKNCFEHIGSKIL